SKLVVTARARFERSLVSTRKLSFRATRLGIAFLLLLRGAAADDLDRAALERPLLELRVELGLERLAGLIDVERHQAADDVRGLGHRNISTLHSAPSMSSSPVSE